MKTQNMTSPQGNKVANQFVILDSNEGWNIEYFQSYDSIIAMKNTNKETGETDICLDINYWDYSLTTGKYRNMFLNETKAETQKKIDSGEYVLTNLN